MMNLVVRRKPLLLRRSARIGAVGRAPGQARLTVLQLYAGVGSTRITTDLEVGVPLSSATLSSGTSAFVSG